jgi:hypothetical protein
MKKTNIDAMMLEQMIVTGAKYLEANREIIDALNVFPVPDGDTGTNNCKPNARKCVQCVF